jgi:hypothetical protein
MYVWFLCRYLSNDSTSIMAYGFPWFSYLVDLLYFDISLRTFSLTYMQTCEYNHANPFAYLETIFYSQNSETYFGTID